MLACTVEEMGVSVARSVLMSETEFLQKSTRQVRLSHVHRQYSTSVEGNGWSQRASPAYVAVIGILMAQYTLFGLDAYIA